MACPEQPLTPRLDPHFCNFRLRIGTSSIHRWGIYAEQDIPKNRKVIEYTGERISRRESKRRADLRGDVYLFTLDDYWNIDGAVNGSGAEFINHSCDPSLAARILKGHILYMSLRDIRRGEELTIDYRFDWDVEKVACRCAAEKCRGTINVRK